MRQLAALFLIAVAINALGPGCAYTVIGSRTQVVQRNPRVLESDVQYGVRDLSLAGNSLVLQLQRTCREVREVDEETLLVETREHNTAPLWLVTATTAGLGLTVAMSLYFVGQGEIDFNTDPICFEDDVDCEQEAADAVQRGKDLQGAAGTVAISTLVVSAVLVGIIIYMEASGEYESEQVLDRNVVRQEVDLVDCGYAWPSGRGVLLATAIGEELPAHASGQGRVEVDVSQAPVHFWSTDGPLQLELPGMTEWLTINLPDSIRQAGLERFGEEQVLIALGFDDSAGDDDARLDAGERAVLLFEVENRGQSTARAVRVEVVVSGVEGIELGDAVEIGDLAPGEVKRGQVDLLVATELENGTADFEAQVASASAQGGRDRLRVMVESAQGPERVFVWYNEDNRHAQLLAAGSARLQTVLTETGRFAFVVDQDTRRRIDRIVELGGGSADERLQRAIEAANQENIRRVFELTATPVVGEHVQFVLSVHDTRSGDRVFTRDTACDASDGLAVLDVFDQLARDFLEWDTRLTSQQR
jgi:hypothetical protein